MTDMYVIHRLYISSCECEYGVRVCVRVCGVCIRLDAKVCMSLCNVCVFCSCSLCVHALIYDIQMHQFFGFWNFNRAWNLICNFLLFFLLYLYSFFLIYVRTADYTWQNCVNPKPVAYQPGPVPAQPGPVLSTVIQTKTSNGYYYAPTTNTTSTSTTYYVPPPTTIPSSSPSLTTATPLYPSTASASHNTTPQQPQMYPSATAMPSYAKPTTPQANNRV